MPVSSPGRRRAEAPPRVVTERIEGGRNVDARERAIWFAAVGVGLVLLAVRIADLGPHLIGPIGSLIIASAYTWAVVTRAGGRPVIFTALTVVLGVVAVAADDGVLRTAASLGTATLGAVLAVVATVPAVRYWQAVREAAIATGIAGVGAVAVLGWEPSIRLAGFEYAVLGLSLVAVFALVFRLGAGLHGLGRRGVAIVAVGVVVLAVTLTYAELLRRYGSTGVVDSLLDKVRWSRRNLGAFPRPLETILGVPALVWGTHMRARRRQGWWVCAFGVAATASVATCLMNPAIGVIEDVLSVVYGLVIGSLIGFVVIRIDLFLTGSPASGTPRRTAGRRAAIDQAEDSGAVRGEPARVDALL